MNNQNVHVLIIDDNEDILFMLRSMFQFKGYQVTVKENADDIENFIMGLSPDIILMDMLLSGANGSELCKQIKSNMDIASIPVVMISAMPHADKICLEAGADYFVSKPFEMDKMISTVAGAVENRNPVI
ncbi:MAG: response regulator [Bacteroidota bacterium]